ncbi:hypothetical protein [Paenibacillus foliorum]|uniref:hypothetical protein n=1 Tax=Paenibacillus foliorum TaxID=2654974 RepID=UPI001490D992|nr:hypothetical protein [Paenibacillus foliorum]
MNSRRLLIKRPKGCVDAGFWDRQWLRIMPYAAISIRKVLSSAEHGTEPKSNDFV